MVEIVLPGKLALGGAPTERRKRERGWEEEANDESMEKGVEATTTSRAPITRLLLSIENDMPEKMTIWSDRVGVRARDAAHGGRYKTRPWLLKAGRTIPDFEVPIGSMLCAEYVEVEKKQSNRKGGYCKYIVAPARPEREYVVKVSNIVDELRGLFYLSKQFAYDVAQIDEFENKMTSAQRPAKRRKLDLPESNTCNDPNPSHLDESLPFDSSQADVSEGTEEDLFSYPALDVHAKCTEYWGLFPLILLVIGLVAHKKKGVLLNHVQRLQEPLMHT